MGRLQNDVEGYYEALGVSHDASAEEIKRAFKEAVKKYHPDVNPSPKAHDYFVLLQEAYEVLGDPLKRRDYDKAHEPPPPPPPSRSRSTPHSGDTKNSSKSNDTGSYQFQSGLDAEPGERVELVICSETGEVTAQPRVVIYTVIISFLFSTWRKQIYGVYSRRGADRAALRASMKTWLFGWWGIPGCFAAYRALVDNMMGGTKPPDENAILLGEQAVAFSKMGKKDLARATLDKAIAFAGDRRLKSELIRYRQLLGPMNKTGQLKDSWAITASPAFWMQLVPLILFSSFLIYLFIAIFGPFDWQGPRVNNDAPPAIATPPTAPPDDFYRPPVIQTQPPAIETQPSQPLPLESNESLAALAEKYPMGSQLFVPPGMNVTLRQTASENADIEQILQPYQTVELVGLPDLEGWARVFLHDYGTGYIRVREMIQGDGTLAYARYCEDNAGTALRNGEVLYRLPGTRGENTMRLNNNWDQSLVMDLRNRVGRLIMRVAVEADSEVMVSGVPDGLYNMTYATGETYSRRCQRFAYGMEVYRLNGNTQFGRSLTNRLNDLPSYRFTLAPEGGGDPARAVTLDDFPPI